MTFSSASVTMCFFHRHECALTVCHEYIITFARNSHACAAAAITLADEIHTFGLCVCFGFKICGQCVADSWPRTARGAFASISVS